MTDERYLTAQEAATELGIRLSTLYAYVSRGLIRSEAKSGKTRARHYWREDIMALKRRKELQRNPAKAAESALHFGGPVLESGITLIANGRFYYRGYDVLALVGERTFEEVATLIWTGLWDVEELFASTTPKPAYTALFRAIAPQLTYLSLIEAFQVVLPFVAANDLAAYNLTAVPQTGVRILRWLTHVITRSQPTLTIAQSLQLEWTPEQSETAALLNTALILCADHELNVSSFTARCVASAGSTPYSVVTAGIAALQGTKHGGYTERVEALFREVGTPDNVRPVLASRLKRGEGVPGFGHRLYPNGDPRGRLLVDLVEDAFPKETAVLLAKAIELEAVQAIGLQPTLDFGLVTLARALHLPPDAALAIFALGRTVGWIGHAIEQYALDRIIRPRARYNGRQP